MLQTEFAECGVITGRFSVKSHILYKIFITIAHIPNGFKPKFKSYFKSERLSRFADSEVSLTRAVDLANLSVWEFARLVEEADAAWVSGDHLEANLDDL
ncbi:hypothetical protein [Halorubrum sp. Ea8]|uniref:hypothetical protein n=1 Tax=Halorubrum sp. Ea8 TaxID=1383841 RepID=UPI0020CEB8A1|nr:hypothetical protein [Halorubrum sp. Ea8]